jgi:hypothetical protein
LLGLFRINDPYRLIVVFILLFGVRLPFMISDTTLTVNELSWMVIGEKLHGGALLYEGLWTDMAPLSAIVYWIVDLIADRSMFAYRLLGAIIFFLQASYFNIILLRHKVFNENNYIPSLLYVLYGLVIFNEITLSPQLMGLTFVLFAINSLFTHMASGRRTDENPLNIGIYTGLSALFYLPFVYFLLAWLLALLLYSSTIWRRYLLLLYGFMFVFFVLWIFYAWKESTRALNADFFQSIFRPDVKPVFELRSMLIILSVPVLILLDSMRRVFRFPGYTNFQVRLQTVFFFLIVVFAFIWIFYSSRDGLHLVLLAPFMSFFLSHSLLLLRKAWKREAAFLFMLVYLLVFYFGVPHDWFHMSSVVDVRDLLVKQVETPVQVQGKKIAVLGDNIHLYRDASLATPYFDWALSKRQLQNLDYYDNVVEILDNFRSDMPDIIVDPENVMPPIFSKIPFLRQRYASVHPGWYVYTNRR